MNGYSHQSPVWGFQSFNRQTSPTYYDRDWSSCNFNEMGVFGNSTRNSNYVYSVYYASDGGYYPIQNMNMTPVKNRNNKRRLYRKK